MRHRKALTGLALVLVAAVPADLSTAQSAAGVRAQDGCFRQLADPSRAHIDCVHPAWLTPSEKADLERVTRGYLKDARCSIDVRIARSTIEAALAAADSVFQSPKLPVRCEIETHKGPVPITGTFAPRVVFRSGKVAEATPGLGDVIGVNAYLAWPAVQYVNRSPGIRAEMARMIDQYVATVWRRRAAGR